MLDILKCFCFFRRKKRRKNGRKKEGKKEGKNEGRKKEGGREEGRVNCDKVREWHGHIYTTKRKRDS